MYFKNFLFKHFFQIKKGGINVFFKKLISFFYEFFQLSIYLISIPIFIVITLIKPWYLIRWKKLYANRIGHFAVDTELYCCERDANINFPTQKYKDFFYLPKYISNKTLENMWRRNITILPRWLIKPIHDISNLFLGKKNVHEIKSPISLDRDVHNLLEKFSSHINFTADEEIRGKEILKKFGLPKNAKFVCLMIRDSGYLNRHLEQENQKSRWDYHSYRDGDIDRYVMAAEELASRGYYVFRMGINVLKPLKSSNPKIIDYANSEIRSDFMDIYLGAKCFFCISTGVGFDAIPIIFRRPIAFVVVPIGFWMTSNEKFLLLTKHHINRLSKKELTISEIFLSNVAASLYTEEFEDRNVRLEENTPEEIRDLAIEMDERLNDKWNETNEDLELQKKFWEIFEKNIKKINLEINLHGKINAKFCSTYLKKNIDLIQ